jgi:hypothetical protein
MKYATMIFMAFVILGTTGYAYAEPAYLKEISFSIKRQMLI